EAAPPVRAVAAARPPGMPVDKEAEGADPRELLQAGLRRAGGVPGVHGGDSTFPRTRLGGPRGGLGRPRRGLGWRERSREVRGPTLLSPNVGSRALERGCDAIGAVLAAERGVEQEPLPLE